MEKIRKLFKDLMTFFFLEKKNFIHSWKLINGENARKTRTTKKQLCRF